MNPNMTQSLVSEHIRESRQQAASARQARAARKAAREARTAAREARHRVARRGRWLVREA